MRAFFDNSDVLPGRRKATRRRPRPRDPQTDNLGDAVVATVWLAFYLLAIGSAVASPIVSRAIEMASR